MTFGTRDTSGELSRDFSSSLVTSADLTSHAIMYFIAGVTFGIFMGIHLSISQYNIVRKNPLEKLSEALIVNNEVVFDGDFLEMFCKVGDRISIQSVFYGLRLEENLLIGEECSLQSALGVIEKHCQGKSKCSVEVSPKNFPSSDKEYGCLNQR